MFRTLDRYIIRQFLGTFFFLLVIIMMIAVVFDISEKTEDFAKMEATTGEIVWDYYLNFIIYYSNLFSGLFIFLAVLLFTSRLAHRTEVIAMLSSGVSFPRFVRPYFIAATFLTIISLYVNVFLLPAANKTRLAFATWRVARQQHADAVAMQDKARTEEDFLRHAVGELDLAAPRPGEEAELAASLALLSNREQVIESLTGALARCGR